MTATKTRKRVAELEGAELDYWVCRAKGQDHEMAKESVEYGFLSPSIDWKWGGPIIERERIMIVSYSHWDEFVYDEHGNNPRLTAPARWWASMPGGMEYSGYGEGWVEVPVGDNGWVGPTPLIAAMRCFVASKFGDEVPEE